MSNQSTRYPLCVGPGGRYLVDQDGEPTLLHGDTAWSLISALTEEQVLRYLADRQARGFNAIIVNLIEHKFNGPLNRYGQGPFSVPGDFTRPNEAYFAFADRCLELAGAHGIQVLLAPIYLGYAGGADDEGWYHEALAHGVEACRAYGRYVGERYGRYDHLIWLMGGDRNPGAALPHVNAVVAGIQEHDRRHLFSAHVAPESSPAVEYGPGGWLTLNATYSYNIVHRMLLADRNRQPTRPFFLIESTYEGEHNATPLQVRRQAYWAMLCGACGQFIGNRPMWGFFEGWEAALDSQAAREMVHLRALFVSRPWHRLVPDQQRELIVGGWGELRGLDTLASACTDDRRVAIAYLPSARAVTVDLAQMVAECVSAWWFDPRSGEALWAGEFLARGQPTLAPPADGDWALVLDDAGLDLPAPGSAG
ncbi:MAG: glycoside hydrolase family 140 protein, partial [Anaerolineae bacterium]|nr:glycoside hydrolase family 140 protein [Anaerolineae bacterium]